MFAKTEVYSGIRGNGTRGVVLNSNGNTLAVSYLERLIGGPNTLGSLKLDYVTLATNGNTITVGGLETLIGSGGQDRVLIAATGTTMAVESIESIIGGSTGTNLIILSDIGNTMSVAFLKSIAGGAGKDVITFGAGGQTGSTAVISNIETVIGTSGLDIIATMGGKSNTVHLQGVEAFLGGAAGAASDVVRLAPGGGTIGVGFLETLIGSSAQDIVTYAWKAGTVDLRAAAGTLAVSSIETIIGSTGGKSAAILLDVNNTVTVSSINTLIGGGGKDVVNVTLRDGSPVLGDGPVAWNTSGSTMMVALIETLTGTAGDDVVVALSNNTVGSNSTMMVSAVESIVGNSGDNTVQLAAGGNTVAVQYLESLIGGSGRDVVTVRTLQGTTMSVAGVETLIGNGGNDVVTLTDTTGTVFVSGIETVYIGAQVVTLDPTESRTLTFPFSLAAPSAPALSTESDSGVPGDLKTSATQPTLTGTAAAGSVVNLYGNGASIGVGTANASGQWSVTPATALGDGVWTLTAKTSAGGQESTASSSLLVTIDATAPTAPTLALTTASDTGASSTDGITKVTTPTVAGSAEAGSVVSLYDGASLLGSATADGSGAWSVAAPTLVAGTHTLTARAVDGAGNTGTVSSALTVTVDTTTAAPTGLALTTGTDTGTPGDNLTAVNTPAISGTAEALSVVSLYEGATLLSSTTANASGVWQATLGALAEGTRTITARAIDLAGNTSTSSSNFLVTIDTTPPVAPSAPSLTALSDSGSSDTDRLTNVTAPTFTGTAEANSVIDLMVSGSVVGTGTANGSGAWTITSSALAEGERTVSTRSRDAAGNTRDGVGNLTVTIDTTAPGAPGGIKLTAATDSGGSATDGVTNLAAPTVTGTAAAGSTVSLYDGASLLGSSTVNAQGNWEFATSGLSVGAHTLTARAVDAAGNTGAASSGFAITVDTTATVPTGLALTTASDTGVSGDRITNLTTPSITGTAEGFSTVTLYENSTILGQATAAANGAWTIASAALTSGAHTVTARAVDLAGNSSGASATFALDIDLTAPDAPSALTLALASDSGTTNDRRTQIVTPTITGTAEAGSVVTLYDGATPLGTGTADASTGGWSIVSGTLTPGVHTITAKAVDTAGNTGAASAGLSLTIDTSSAQPTGLALATASDSGSSSTDGLTNVTTPTVTGTAEAGATVTLYNGVVTLGTGIADDNGLWSVTSSALTAGAHTLTAVAVDVAGNSSVESSGLSVTIDTTGPDLGTLSGNADPVAPTITGSAEAGSVVTLYDSPSRTTALGMATAGTAGAWSIATPEFAAGTYTLTARAVDAAGNSSTDSQLTVALTGRVGIPGSLLLATDTGTSTSDRLTNAAAPTITGTAQAGGTITLSNQLNVVLGTAVADGGGLWSIVSTATLGDGTHTLKAEGQNNGTALGISSGLTITIDTTGPAAPGALTLQAASDTGLSAADGITSALNPVVTGTAEAGSLITLYDSDGASVVGVATSSSNGAWSVTSTLTAGTHTLTAKAVDAAGNTGTASDGLTLTIDRQGDTPTIQVLATDTGTPSDGITSALAPTLTGTAEAGGTVSLYNGSSLVGTGTADAVTGTWTITASALGNGSHDLSAQLVDVAGNTSLLSSSFGITIDASAPGAPSGLTLSSDTGTAGDGITSTASQTITGTAEAGSTVVLYDGTSALGTVNADTLGAWTLASGTLALGSHTLTAHAVDLAGNTGATSAALTVTIDTATPDPSGLALTTASDTGLSATDRITSSSTLALTGSAEANSTITVYDNGSATPLGSATADGTGAWSFTTSGFTEGTHTLTASAVDLAGNSSSGSGTLTVTIDQSVAAPAAPVLATGQDTGVALDNRTRHLAPVVTGTVEANAQVSLYDDTAFVGMTTADGSGVWQIAGAMAEGTHTLTTRVVDLAGNSTVSTGSLVITIDATAPNAPTDVALTPASDSVTVGDRWTNVTTPVLTGSAEANSTVTLYSGSVAVGTATADSLDGLWTATAVSLADGIHTLTTRAVDSADNTSGASTALLVTIDTSTPVPSVGLTAATDSGRLATDGVTRIAAPTFTGTAEAGSVVTITDAGTLLGIGTATSTGLWSVVSPTLTQGAHTLTAVAVDGAGNTATASNVFTVTVDLSASAPTGLLLASDSGADASDRLTNNRTPTITGTAEAYAAVQLYDGALLVGATTADVAGSWSAGTTTLINGAHTLTAVAIDLAGNTSMASAGLVVTVDTVSDTPSQIALSAASDTGVSSTDGLTRLATPAVVGVAESLAVVTLYEGGAAIGTAAADTLGAFTITSDALAAGLHTLTVRSIDRAGNTSTASNELVVTVDLSTVQPSLQMAQASDTGVSNSDRVTAVTQPLTSGTAEAGSIVTLYASGVAVGTTQASTLGAWSITATTMAPGTYTLSAVAVDQAGNTSMASAGLDVTIDTAAAAPSLTLSTTSNSGTTSDTITNVSTPELTGTTEAGGVVSLYEGATLLGTGTANSLGVWTAASAQLANGAHTLTARVVDLAGNTSTLSAGLVVTIDRIAPNAATGMVLATGSDTGVSTTDRITNLSTPALSGTAEANSTITLYDGNVAVGTATASGSGVWTAAPGSALTNGQHDIKVTVTDVAGNVSAANTPISVTIDTVAPTLSALSLIASTDTGSSSTDGVTRTVAPTVTGTVEANSTVTLYDGATTIIGTATANGLGIWSASTATLTAAAHTLSAIAVDRAGNTSAASADFVVTIDTSATIPTSLALAVDSGSSSTDRLINTGTPTIVGSVGTAEANGLVQLYDGTNLVGTGTAGGDGAFTVTSSGLGAGTHNLTARLIDVAGNTSSASTALGITVDTTAPDAPGALTLTTASDSGALSNDRITSVTTPTVTGTADVGSTVVLYDGATALGTATATSGAWTITAGSALSGSDAGTVHSLVAIAIDAAGNTGAASSTLTVTVDTGGVPPSSLALATASDTGILGDSRTASQTPTINGLAEVGSTVTLFEGSTNLGTATADEAGFWSITSGQTLAGGTGTSHLLFATIVDLAGNTSTASTPLLDIVIDTVPDTVTVSLDADSDTGTPGDRITGNTTPVLTGVAGINRPVIISLNGSEQATVTANGSGAWLYTAGPLSGTNNFSVSSDDGIGNIGTDGITVTIDTTGDTPSAPVLATGSDSGRNATDNRTNIVAPTIRGTAEAGGTVTLYDGGSAIGTVAASGLGTWVFTTPTLGSGDHTLTARVVDVTGNTSNPSAGLVVTIDTLAAEPNGLELATASNSGSVLDSITRFAAPTITGTTEAGNAVMLYDGGILVGVSTANGSGTWSVQSSGLGEGTHSLTARTVDIAGNTSDASTALTITIDTTAPTAPTLALPAASDSGTLSDDRLTNVSSPTITGSADAGSTVTLYDGASSLGTVIADGGGLWTITTSSTLAAGTHNLTALSVDLAGNTGAASSALTVTIDTSATTPSALDLDTASDSGTSTTDGITSVTAPTILGLADANSVVTLTNGASLVGSATADGSGSWSITASNLADGTYSLTATAVDVAGNTSQTSTALNVTIDTTCAAPTSLAFASGTDVGRSTSDGVTSVTTPTVTGSAEANSVVQLYDGGSIVGQATASGLGAWTITTSPLSEAAHTLTARAVDHAGNTSLSSTDLALTIDTTMATPSLFMATASDTGSASDDLLTRNATPTFTGSVEALSVVKLYDGSSLKGTTTADALGAWTITSSALSEGERQISIQAEDVAGNTATASQISAVTVDGSGNTTVAASGLNVRIDTVAPTAPGTLTLSADSDSGIANNGLTNVSSPTVGGTAEASAQIRIYDGAVLVGETEVDENGNWSSSTSSLAAGLHTLTAMAVDLAGNTSLASGGLSLTITPELAAPTITLATASDSGTLGDNRTNVRTPTVTGTAVASGLVTLYAGISVVGTTTADGSGVWSITSGSLTGTSQTLRAVSQDLDGVESPSSAAFTITLDTVAPTLSGQTPAQNAADVGVSSGLALTLTFDEEIARGTGNLLLKRRSDDATVATVAVTDTARVQISGSTVTVIPGAALSYSTGYYLEAPSGAFTDLAGNAYAGLAVVAGIPDLAFVTMAQPTSTQPSTPSEPTLVDGVAVQQQQTTNADGTVTRTLTIPAVSTSRVETVGNNNVADIPLATGATGQILLTAQLPAGLGMQVSGQAAPKPAGNSLNDLITEIQARTTVGSPDQTRLTGGGFNFLAALPTSTPLLVQTVVPTMDPGSTALTQRLVISAPPTTEADPTMTALVIDTRNLPAGSEIGLENVDFAVVIGAVRVTGGDGSQNVWGDNADQYIVLGADDDTLHGGGGNDFVGSKTGNDLLYGDDGNDTVQGGDDNDSLFGGGDNDLMLGNMGQDLLLGNMGADTLHAGRGNDTLFGGRADDILFGNEDDDLLEGDDGDDRLFGNIGQDVLFGNQGADTLYGGQGNDTVYSGRGDDLLFGDAGDDLLFGDLGNDTMAGGAGADLFVFGETFDATLKDGHDVVTDFNAAEGDRIQLRNGLTYSLAANAAGQAVIVFSNNDDVTLTNIRRDEFQANWIVRV